MRLVATQTRSNSSRTTNEPVKKKKDLIERLMDKGLIPLAAMDIIRGWMVLEMSAGSDVEKSLVKAATQNKLGYDAIRTALLGLHEDRDRFPGHKGKGKGFHANWVSKDRHSMAEDYEPEFDNYQAETWHEDPYTWQEGFYGQEEEWPWEENHEGDQEETESEDPEKVAMLAQLQEEETTVCRQ